MSGQVILRFFDTYFRHKWLYLVPVVLLGAAGVWSATSTEDSYQSFGTMKVERATQVAVLTGSQQDPDFGWSSPAGATADSVNALLRTQTFLDEVIAKAGLQDAVDQGLLTADDVRGSIAVWPDGSRLVKFGGVNRYPDIAYRVAGATMDTYVDTVIENESSDSRVAVEYLEERIPALQDSAEEAAAALAAWIDEHPAPVAETQSRPEDEQMELERLQDAVSRRDQRLIDVEQGIEQAEISQDQKEAEVRQRFEVIDPPQQPVAPQPKLRKGVIKVAMAILLGAFVALIGVAIATILDRTIRYPADVKARLGTRVLAVVPHTRLSPAMRARLQVPPGDDDAASTDDRPPDEDVATTNGQPPGEVEDSRVVAWPAAATPVAGLADEPAPDQTGDVVVAGPVNGRQGTAARSRRLSGGRR